MNGWLKRWSTFRFFICQFNCWINIPLNCMHIIFRNFLIPIQLICVPFTLNRTGLTIERNVFFDELNEKLVRMRAKNDPCKGAFDRRKKNKKNDDWSFWNGHLSIARDRYNTHFFLLIILNGPAFVSLSIFSALLFSSNCLLKCESLNWFEQKQNEMIFLFNAIWCGVLLAMESA